MSRHAFPFAVVALALVAAALPTAALGAGPASRASAGPAALGGAVAAAPSASTVTLVKVVDVNGPVLVTSPKGDARLFIVSKAGRIRIVRNGALLATPFLDISGGVSKGSEQGLLGMAFHPSFATNRRFYVNFTNLDGNTVIREYRASRSNPDVVEPGSGRTILRINQPFANHNGGMLAFGRDGYLYIGMGDGGSGGDPGNRAQDKDSLLGKILRIDINGTSSGRQYRNPGSNPYVGRPGRNEIWQRGVRNPWRFSFDRSTGDLWIGDVGQDRYEEVDRARLTSTGPGRGVNWGWHQMEGTHCYVSGCNRTGKRLPLLEYAHSSSPSRCSVTGGYVYRGSAIAALRGWYVYGDYCSGEVWAVAASASRPASPVKLLGAGSGRMVSGFGQDAAGELYLCDIANGIVYRIRAS